MSDWNASIVEEFRANEGKVGGQFEGASLILIHHVGARSGTKRVTPLGCFPQSDGGLVIVATNGGAPTNPDWYYNLKANPDITVEFGTETFTVAVRELIGAEFERAWAGIVSAAPQAGEFRAKAGRAIPVLLLTRTSGHA
jgi:deazaflavin-dependent oxidoreductase (nitroreductase family)